MRILLSCGLLALLPVAARAQVGVGTTTPDAKSALDIRATDKGLLIPRLTAAQRTAITSPPQGLMVYQTDGTSSGGAQTGFWYYAGVGGWVFIEPAGADNLGNHTATQNLNLTDKLLVGGTAAAPGTQGLKVDASGRVGIGLAAGTSPAEQLHVDGGNAKIGLAQWATTADDRLLRFGDGSFVTLGETGGDDLLQFQAKDFRFNASGRSYTGNVGIGLGTAVAASERLEVGGSIKLTGTAGTDGLVFPDGTRQTTAATSSGFTLPYSGSAGTAGSVFQITNSGGGIGVRGASASGQGVVGRVNGTGAGQGVVGVKGTTIPNVEDAGVVGLSEADYGVYARSSQSSGVVGISDGTAANLAGVTGSSTATSGVGVFGTAPGTGVRGVSSTGAGLDGTSSANANTTGGVVGRNTSSANGVGVLGLTASGYGVRGVASASNGYGVQGVASDSYGVIGQSTSGVGTYGSSTSSYGVQGTSSTSSGLYGNSSASALTEAGVKGTNTSGNGVLGQATTGHGVRGEATGSGNGVYGQASGTGRAAYFTQTNSSSPAYAVEINQAGSGDALNVTGGAVRTPAVHTPYTGPHNMVAVAYGSLDYFVQSRTVHLYNSSGNFTVSVDPNHSGEFLFNFTPGSLGSNSNYGLTVVANVAGSSEVGFVCQTSSSTASADLALTTYKVFVSTGNNPTPTIFADWMRFSFVVYSD